MEEIEEQQKRKVVKELKRLMELRNTESAFDLEGEIEVKIPREHSLEITRSYGNESITLKADLQTFDFCIVKEENVIYQNDLLGD